MPVCSVCFANFSGERCPRCGTLTNFPAQTFDSPVPVVIEPAVQSSPVVRPESPTVMATPVINANTVEGVVVQVQGPVMTEPPGNGWKSLSLIMLMIGLLPIMIFWWIISFCFKLVFGMMFGYRGSHNGSLLDELLIHHGLTNLFRKPDPIPVYHLVVETSDGNHEAVRQDGDVGFRIFPGNHVRVTGNRRQGVLIADQIENRSLGISLSKPANGWKLFAFLLMAGLVFEFLILLSAGHR